MWNRRANELKKGTGIMKNREMKQEGEMKQEKNIRQVRKTALIFIMYWTGLRRTLNSAVAGL